MQNKRLKQAGVAVLVGAVAFFSLGQTSTNRIVTATKFVLVDDSGQTRGNFEMDQGRPTITLNSKEGRSVVMLNGSDSGAVLFVSSPDNTETASIVVGGSLTSINARTPSGSFAANAAAGVGGPNIFVADNDSYSSVLGRSIRVNSKTGQKEQSPTAALTMFDHDKKVIWSAP